MTICRRTSTNRMALANGIRDATVTYMLSTNATPFVDSLSGCCAVSLPPISFIFASRLPFIIHGLPFYSRYKDFMPKGSLTVATNCRYCNKPHGMKAGAETHPAWMPREFPNDSCRIFVPFSFINDRSSFHFYYFVPPICETVPTVRQSDILHLSGVTSRKMKNDHLPKDKHEQNGIG